ncbi:MAG: phosphate regulon sensor histidine kinase PhoR [Burkholderiaceae bacterium]
MLLLRTLIPVALALTIGAVLAWLFDDQVAAWWLAGSFFVYALYHAAYLARLHHWAALPRQRQLPLGSGPWSAILDRLSRHAKQENESQIELLTELERIHSAVDQLPDGLVVLDRYDHVEWSNDAAQELHGIFGRHRPIHHFIRQPEFVAFLEKSDFSKPIVLNLPNRPGRVFELRMHQTGDALKLLITRDITDHAKLDAMRRDFVANVSHEIRTPVTVIGGFAETLLDLDLPPDQHRDYLTTILKQSQTMQRLVEDLLMLSSLENSSAPPAEEVIDMPAMVRTLTIEARTISQGRHTIEHWIDSDLFLRAAPLEIESAVRNLITNAIRYTPDGGRITLVWTVRGEEGWISVRDTGIGIAAEHLPRLTERFYRVERSRSRESGGTGLGLAIVKHIMQRHRGRLDIQSEAGKGSTFSLRLPLDRLAPPIASADAEPPADPARQAGQDAITPR